MKFKPYPKYMASGIPWLSRVPEGWTISPLKWLVTQLNEKPDPTKSAGEYVGMENIAPFSGKWVPSSGEDDSFLLGNVFQVGDVLFGKLRPYLAKAWHADRTGICSSELLVLRPRSINAQYLLHHVLNQEFITLVDSSTYGSKMPRASWDFIGAIQLPIPSQDEQLAIATFLDRETTKIDTMIAKQERLIDLLKEKRQAVISHAVTKGLDPMVPMKSSGVEWLGDVPEHWTVLPIRYVAQLASGHTPSRQHPEWWKDCSIPWFSLADVWQIRDGKVEYVTKTKEMISEIGLANSSARLLPKGTVILSRTASVGYSAIMGVDMATTQDFANWVCGPQIFSEYLLYVFRSMSSEFKRLNMGSTHQTIYMPDISAFRCPLPSVDEQNRIVKYVRKSLSSFDILIAKAQQAISLQKEHRTALISAAVTGKIDVRETTSELQQAA